MVIDQADITTAFLNGLVEETILYGFQEDKNKEYLKKHIRYTV